MTKVKNKCPIKNSDVKYKRVRKWRRFKIIWSIYQERSDLKGQRPVLVYVRHPHPRIKYDQNNKKTNNDEGLYKVWI